MRRAQDRVAKLADNLYRNRGSTDEKLEYEDAVISFFQIAWHLKDWIRSDTSLNRAQRDGILSRVEHDPILGICADIANRTKHRLLTRSRMDAVLDSSSPSSVEPDWEQYVVAPDGVRRDAATATRLICDVWDGILRGPGVL